MKYCCYIIYSSSINRYYIGYTSDIEERLKLHNNGYFGNKSYTSRASDWTLYFTIPCDTIEMAQYIEKQIKKMKSRKYIEDLSVHPEMVKKIEENYLLQK